MNNKGFTMVEVVISLVILAVAIMGLSSTTARLARVAVEAETRALALQAVEDRISTGSPPPHLPTAGLRLFRVRRRSPEPPRLHPVHHAHSGSSSPVSGKGSTSTTPGSR